MNLTSIGNLIGRVPLMDTVARRILNRGGCVFMFHRVLPQGQLCYEPELVTSEGSFEHFVDWVTGAYEVLPLEVLVQRRTQQFARKKPDCAITFDDGWIDNFHHAFPVLRERQLPATIFLPVRFIGTTRRFWQERLWFCLHALENTAQVIDLIAEASRHFPWFRPKGALPASERTIKRFLTTRPSDEADSFVQSLEECASVNLPSDRAFMNWDEVEIMRREGISFGSHTLHHTLLSNSSPHAAEIEIRQSREELLEHLNFGPTSFSYPWGMANTIVRDQVQQSGYTVAVTTEPGLVNSRTGPWLVPRIPISNSVLQNSQTINPGRTRLSFAKQVTEAAVRRLKRPKVHCRPVRIVFLIDQIDGWEGGTERQLHTLITQLDRQYFEPELICIFGYQDIPKDSFPCPVHFICDKERPPFAFARLIRLARLLRRIKPDAVQTYFPESNTLGILAARFANLHAIIGTTRNASDRDRAMLRLSGRIAHGWQCNSRSVAGHALKQINVAADKIEVLPNAVDLSRFNSSHCNRRAAIRAGLGLKTEGPIIISVANLRPVKDLSTLIEAARLVHSDLPSAEFVLVGEGPLYDQLQEQVRESGLTHVVRFVGVQPDVLPYLTSADIGVLTSISEGSSNSLLEYMAMGLPTVVSDVPANRELVDGLFFTPGDATKLAEILVDLWRDPSTRQEVAERNRRAALQFGIEACVQRAEGYYNRLLPATF